MIKSEHARAILAYLNACSDAGVVVCEASILADGETIHVARVAQGYLSITCVNSTASTQWGTVCTDTARFQALYCPNVVPQHITQLQKLVMYAEHTKIVEWCYEYETPGERFAGKYTITFEDCTVMKIIVWNKDDEKVLRALVNR